uniref:Uncharacterized protein n=1 Tax=Anguilla anguilla TaxID=7936 RepID=A0A0E9TVA2_ANGAN
MQSIILTRISWCEGGFTLESGR